jgi:hypothetical protein
MKTRYPRVTLILILYAITSLFVTCTININDPSGENDSTEVNNGPRDEFSLAEWEVTENSIGPIEIGDDYSSIRKHLNAFELKKISSYELGYDGSETFMDMYYWNGSPAFYFEFEYESNKINKIGIIHKDLKTKHGIGTGSTVSDIINHCPGIDFYQNLIDDGEYATCYEISITFEFDQAVCNYTGEDSMAGNPVNLRVKPARMILGIEDYGC